MNTQSTKEESLIRKKKLEDFFSSPLVIKAIQPLKEGCTFSIQCFDGETFTLRKENHLVKLVPVSPDPDLTVFLAKHSLELLNYLNHINDLGDLGVEILTWFTHQDPDKKIRLRINAGFLSLVKKGYLRIIPLGGKKVARFLAQKGLKSMVNLKKAIERMKNN